MGRDGRSLAEVSSCRGGRAPQGPADLAGRARTERRVAATDCQRTRTRADGMSRESDEG